MRLIFALLIFMSLSAYSAMSPGVCTETINVSAAISLKDALGDAAKTFEASSGIHVELTLGASGTLANQILQGAPADLFISADTKHVDDLVHSHLIDAGTARVIARNSLVLIVPADAASPPTSFAQLADASVKRIAIGEPKTVPAGEYSMETLSALKLQDAVGPRLVYGSNVRQVLTYVEAGEVSAGIVYATDAAEAGGKVKVVATADASTHQPIAYYAAPIASGKERASAGKFLDYLLGPQGQAALQSHKFQPADIPATERATTEPAATKPARAAP